MKNRKKRRNKDGKIDQRKKCKKNDKMKRFTTDKTEKE